MRPSKEFRFGEFVVHRFHQPPGLLPELFQVKGTRPCIGWDDRFDVIAVDGLGKSHVFHSNLLVKVSVSD